MVNLATNSQVLILTMYFNNIIVFLALAVLFGCLVLVFICLSDSSTDWYVQVHMYISSVNALTLQFVDN